MTKSQILDRVLDPGIVAVIRVDSAAPLLLICDALPSLVAKAFVEAVKKARA